MLNGTTLCTDEALVEVEATDRSVAQVPAHGHRPHLLPTPNSQQLFVPFEHDEFESTGVFQLA